jgi:hypothetical protein
MVVGWYKHKNESYRIFEALQNINNMDANIITIAIAKNETGFCDSNCRQWKRFWYNAEKERNWIKNMNHRAMELRDTYRIPKYRYKK